MQSTLRFTSLPLFASTLLIFVLAAATALSMASTETARPPLLDRVLTPVVSLVMTPVLQALPGPSTLTTASLD